MGDNQISAEVGKQVGLEDHHYTDSGLWARIWVYHLSPIQLAKHRDDLISIFRNYLAQHSTQDVFFKQLVPIVDYHQLNQLIKIAFEAEPIPSTQDNDSLNDRDTSSGNTTGITPTEDVVSETNDVLYHINGQTKDIECSKASPVPPIYPRHQSNLPTQKDINKAHVNTTLSSNTRQSPVLDHTQVNIPDKRTKNRTQIKKNNRSDNIQIRRKRLRAPPNLWTKAESRRLIDLAYEHGLKSWKQISAIMNEEFGSNKNPGQCSQHYHRVAAPTIKHSVWSPSEDKRLQELAVEHSLHWYNIAKAMPGRTDTMCRRRFLTIQNS